MWNIPVIQQRYSIKQAPFPQKPASRFGVLNQVYTLSPTSSIGYSGELWMFAIRLYVVQKILSLVEISRYKSGVLEPRGLHITLSRWCETNSRRYQKVSVLLWRAIACVLFFARSALKLRIHIQGSNTLTQCKIPAGLIGKVNFISYKVIIVNTNKIARLVNRHILRVGYTCTVNNIPVLLGPSSVDKNKRPLGRSGEMSIAESLTSGFVETRTSWR